MSTSPIDILRKGTIEIIVQEELMAQLGTKRPLRVKAGFDPTAPDLHLGHTVIMQKLKQWQDLGHQVILVIGDFTARIGDPTGRSETRPMLSEAEITHNAKTYVTQVGKILDVKKAEIRYNSEWLGKMPVLEYARLGAKATVARMLERDDFKTRFKAGDDISIMEFYYPLMQAYDSVILRADVEIGGNDQLFNLLMGRTMQKRSEQKPQIVVTLPLLLGTDGVQKMSKSYGNAIGIEEPPQEIFGKLMSISDDLMWEYYTLLTDRNADEVTKMKREVMRGTLHPKEAKKQLGIEIVTRFHSAAAAKKVAEEFDKVFALGKLPTNIETVTLKSSNGTLLLSKFLAEQGLAKSGSEARRLIEQGGVRLNETKVNDPGLTIEQKGEYLIQVGKRRFKRICFTVSRAV